MSSYGMSDFCNCRACKRMKRKGRVLGTARYGNYFISAYVPHPRFAKGKRVRRPLNKKEYDNWDA